MRIDILTVLPGIFTGPFNESIIKRAKEKGIVDIVIHDIREYSDNKHRRVDDYVFGGEAGMVLQPGPIFSCVGRLKSEREYQHVIYMTPDGVQHTQKLANSLSLCDNLIIICGHYKGIDQRLRDNIVTLEISIGDYVITGGELAAAVVADSIIRLLPDAISDISSALSDSFQDNLLAPPVYTRPEVFNGWKVPEVLLSGNQKKIDEWKLEMSLERTRARRPDLLED
jgi:tRNA (guanine37-N1)-methyltransferase